MIKVIIRSILYPWFILFAGICLGFICNSEYVGEKTVVIERSINNIFFPVEYNEDIENLTKCIEPLKKLNNLIGMDSIKQNIIDQVLFYTQGLNTNEMMHTCLTGPPGVGKTTLGKILSEIYSNLGFLSTNKFRVVSRPELIAGYVGQTALKTLKVLNESKGGVLFIDEAYSLGGGQDESGTSYSKECLDTLNQNLTERRDFLCIIAGYEDSLESSFFSFNEGLKRRFSFKYVIDKYTGSELKDIFLIKIKKEDWEYVDDIDELDRFFRKNIGPSIFYIFYPHSISLRAAKSQNIYIALKLWRSKVSRIVFIKNWL
jgi:SpoVK/Ycf46/Vps4 family AAA+-type ATPase